MEQTFVNDLFKWDGSSAVMSVLLPGFKQAHMVKDPFQVSERFGGIHLHSLGQMCRYMAGGRDIGQSQG